MKSDRRSFLKRSGLAGAGVFSAAVAPVMGLGSVPAEKNMAPEAAELTPLNRFPRMMQEYFVQRLKTIEQETDKRRAALQTKADAVAFVEDIREKITSCFGPWPERTPLNARITGVVKRKGYRIEKVIFESRPGFPVTANLYLPAKKGRLPAVLGTCGHGDAGKAYPSYQSFAQGLARKGYVVLIYDPISQGERLQYASAGKSRYGTGVPEHLQAGAQLLLTGDSLSNWFVWDGKRALDYLLTRPEVDSAHIGVTGNSGGGTQTAWLCATDSRITMAAPGCFITTFLHNLENENPADSEQCPPEVLALGLDQSDFIAAMAPKPVILLAQEKDFFDVRGTEQAFARLKTLYRLLGAEDNIRMYTGSDYHGYSQENREAMYGFFNDIVKNGASAKEPALELEPERTLWCTATGQVGDGAVQSIAGFVREAARGFKLPRKPLVGEALQYAVRSLLKMPAVEGVPGYRILRPLRERNYPKKLAAVYTIETEPGIMSIVYRLSDDPIYSRPHGDNKPALLYISDLSADAELRTEPLLRQDVAVYACDVRGSGESQPNTCSGSFLAPAGSDYFYAAHAVMIGYPYVGQKTFDVLRVIAWLKAAGHSTIHLIGNGRGAVPATFAALLSDDVSEVTLKGAEQGYGELAENPERTLPLSLLLPGVLKTFDLEDCYAALQAKRLTRI
ncbi:alpha/beta hydrolase family protein [Chitinophaga lutea]